MCIDNSQLCPNLQYLEQEPDVRRVLSKRWFGDLTPNEGSGTEKIDQGLVWVMVGMICCYAVLQLFRSKTYISSFCKQSSVAPFESQSKKPSDAGSPIKQVDTLDELNAEMRLRLNKIEGLIMAKLGNDETIVEDFSARELN